MDKEEVLNSIFDNDPLGLLDIKAKNPVITADDRLIASFEEINAFYEQHAREPQKNTDMNERGLFSRLDGIRNNPSKAEALKKYDRFNLLTSEEVIEINSIDDIFNSDAFDILDTKEDDDIHTLINVPKIDKDRAETDFVARREKFDGFEEYKPLFIQCQQELKDGKRRLVKFNEKFFEEGAFFILKGVMVYLEKIHKVKKDKHHKLDARTHLIFENATHSNMLLRSFGKGLYEDGYFVSEHEDKVLNKLHNITDDDKQNGYIYILKSLSTDDRIATKRNLYKIGFSTTTVETRIKNAKEDPTYLMADVKTMAAYEVYNVNPHKLEQLIHQFFGNSCLDIDIVGDNGKVHRPREWFVAPLEAIEEAIELIINGRIVDYRYDSSSERIVSK